MGYLKEVMVPLWVLRVKVENDYDSWVSDYSMLKGMGEEDLPSFPELDSTKKCIQIFEKEGIQFNLTTGEWSDAIKNVAVNH